ncbi:MAG: hypothetical protein IJA22_02970 [Clostridia bacterium]|nr:hypothetical protein [Clostridia bacterium]
METKKIPEFCIDLSAVAELFYIHVSKAGLDAVESDDNMLEVYNLLEKGQIKFHISENVLNSLQSQYKSIYHEILDFIETHNFEKVAIKSKTPLWNKYKELAWKYSQPLYFSEVKELQEQMGDKGVNMNLYRAVFELSNENNLPMPTAYTTAHAAIVGLPMLVSNLDFVKNYRPEIIAYENASLGFSRDAKPITAEKLLEVVELEEYPVISEEYIAHLKENKINTKNMDIKYIHDREDFFEVENLENQNWVNEERAEFCVDSCVVIDLFYYEYLANNSITSSKETMQSNYDDILSLIKGGSLKLYITSTVMKELQHRFEDSEFAPLKVEMEKFLEDYNFEYIDLSKPLFAELKNRRNELIQKYITPLAQQEIDIEKHGVKNWQKDTILYEPTFDIDDVFDAKIMAEAAAVGVPLVTINTIHFMSDNRAKMIEIINASTKGVSRDARPITAWGVLDLLKKGVNPQLNSETREILDAELYDSQTFSLEIQKYKDYEK